MDKIMLIKCRWVCKCGSRGHWSTYKELVERTVQRLARRHMRRPGHHHMELEAKRQYRSSIPTSFTRIVSHTIVNDMHLVHGFENLEEG